MDAALSVETREYLQNLTKSQRQVDSRLTELSGEALCVRSVEEHPSIHQSAMVEPSNDPGTGLGAEPFAASEVYLKVEVPLHSDWEFFEMLRQELSNLHTLQASERDQLTDAVNILVHDMSKVSNPSKGLKASDLYAWREIFEFYIESEVFFSTKDRNGGSRNSMIAQRQLEWFTDKLYVQGDITKLKRKESHIALEQFLRINLDLLRNLKFQEINQTAMAKILKSMSPQA